MNIDPYILTFSAATVIATVWMGFWSARRSRTAHDFFVAGRTVSVGWNASAISGEYLSAASFMGVAGMVMSSGYDALWYPVCYACGYLFLLLFIAGPLRRFGAYTIPDFAEGRFDSPVFRKIAVVFVLFIGFFYTMPQMKGAGTTLAYIFPGLPYWAGVVLVGAVITLNVALGGMKGITLVQAFQYWLKMFAISVPVFVLMSVYGHYGKQLGQQQTKSPTAAVDSSIASIDGIDSFEEMNALALQKLGRSLGRNVAMDPFMEKMVTIGGAASNVLSGISGGAGEVRGRAAFSMAILKGRNIYGFRATNVPLSAALVHYATQTGQKVWQDDDVSEASDRVTFDTTPSRISNRSDAAEEVAAAVRKARFQIVTLNAQEAICFTSDVFHRLFQANTNAMANSGGRVIFDTSRHVGRAALPDNAPKDAAWLNPFGPLTTKAAKAANIAPVDQKRYALLYTYSLIIALVCGTAGLPHILVRFYTNPDGVAAKRTTMWVMILIGIFYVFPPIFGVMGRNLMPELYAATGAKGTDKVVLELPRVLNAVESRRSSAEGQNASSPSTLATRPSTLPWGSILSGITCAGAFAAFMSTFSGLLVSMTGALAHDVYGRMLRPNSTPQQRMRMFRISAVLIGGVAIVLGTFVEPFQINFMVGQAFAIAAASYFPLLFMSVWWRGLTMRGAAVGMLVGGFSAVAAISLSSLGDLAVTAGRTGELFNAFKPLDAFWKEHPLLRILCEQPAIWSVPIAIGLMIIVSKLTRKEVPSDIRMKMLVLHAPEKLGLKQEYIQDHGQGH